MAARPEAVGTAGILSARSEQRQAEKRRVFDQLFAEHWLSVKRHVECYLEVDADVHEVVAEVFQLAWEGLRVAHPRGLTWLLRIADGVLRSRTRSGAVRGTVVEAVHRNVVTESVERSTLDRRDVFRAMAQLSQRERRVVVLTYWDDLSVGEVGEVMRSRPGAVRATLRRARDKLRDALEGESSW
ncbi:sigma-70 family RNA polymerase sigma factor [Microbacterium sp. M28]|uniref:RNA polymerase sigma factor n=1 Tax=Microbacterium sp. M28 TaxID=2962064 RepID=UPI0021F471C3|nr:sigma-70 family RNA polymerase sigma factor [Microbacterium sp. M28]UYO95743.1 sigma-70 family RNA polymerase sigma factor [Microbacterium sp. M28]